MINPKTSSRTSRSVVDGLEARVTRLREGGRERGKEKVKYVYMTKKGGI